MDQSRQLLFLMSAIVSSSASACNLILLWDMNKWTGHTKLIALISLYQLLYDTAFYTSVESSPGTDDFYAANILSNIGGCTSAFTSNIMMLSILYIVRFRKSLDVNDNIQIIHALVNIPSCIIFVVFLYSLLNHSIEMAVLAQYIYSSLRMVSIVLNIVPYLYMTYLLRISNANARSGSSDETSRLVIGTLVSRMRYYPLVQALARIAPSWYEMQYGFDFATTDVSTLRFSAAIAIAVLCPLTSIGYLIIFLITQPRAWLHLKCRILHCKRYVPEKLFQQQESTEAYSIRQSTKVFKSTFYSFSQPRFSSPMNTSSCGTCSGGFISDLDESELIHLLDHPIPLDSSSRGNSRESGVVGRVVASKFTTSAQEKPEHRNRVPGVVINPALIFYSGDVFAPKGNDLTEQNLSVEKIDL